MEDFSPDFIARLASRIYNEPPNANGHAPPHGILPNAPNPATESSPHLPGGVPASVTHAPPHSFPGGLDTPSHFPQAPHEHIPSAAIPVAPNASGFTTPNFDIFRNAGAAIGPAGPAPFSQATTVSPTGSPGFPTQPLQAVSSPGQVAASAPTPPAMPEGAATPGFMSHSPGPSETAPGVSAFVQRIRQTHLTHRGEISQSSADLPARDTGFLHHATRESGSRAFDLPAIRDDFPVLRQHIHGKPIAWLDNAATTQKPQNVIDAVRNFYENDYSNIHRGAHSLAARATDAYEKARQKVQSFIGASSISEIVFVRGTTEGINLIANTYGRKFLQPGDDIVLSMLEHHAQIVPWQMIAKEKGANLRVIPVNDRGEIMMEEYQKLLGPRTKVVALTQASNSLGTILPVHEMTQIAKRYGARVVIDGAQSVAHIPVNMQELGADFFVFSGHKVFAPTGIGAVFIKEELHDMLPPWQGGGNMIRNVTFEETSYSEAPARFEAGTPSIGDAIGLGAAIDYVNRLGLPNIAAYEHKLLEYATEHMLKINGLRLIGTAREKVGVLSFVLPNRRTEDVGRYLDQEGIAVRAGHHCSQPSLRRFGLESTVRPSLSLYNTHDEIDRLVDAIQRLQRTP